MSITDIPHGTDIPHSTVVPFQKPGAGIQPKLGIATDASMQVLAERALAALSVCDDAHTEAHLVARTMRAITASKHHGAERLWMFDLLMEKLGKLKDRAKHVPRPPSFFHTAIWFSDLFEPIDAVMTLLLETIDGDRDRSLRINLAAKLEKLLQEVDDLMHRIAAGWERPAASEKQTTAH